MCASYPQEIEFADYTMRSCRENSDFSAFFGSMQSEIQYEDDSYHPVQMDLVQQMRFRSENDSESASPNMSTPNRDPLFVLNFNDDDFEEETDVVIQPSERLFGQLSRLTANGDYPIYGCDKIYAIESEANAFVLNEKGELIPQLRDSEQNTEISILPIFQRKKPLPLLYEAEPIYVNARQYDRILKLRIKRAIAGKIKGPDYVFLQPRSKTYKHESRSKHAKNRRREGNGRFTPKPSDCGIDFDAELQEKNSLCPKIKRRQT